MSLLTEIIGAAVAVEAVKSADSNASLLEEGVAAYAGFKGVEVLTEHLEAAPIPNHAEQSQPT